MITGYEDLRNELCEILGAHVTEEDIDVAVTAIINEDHTTATPALAELNSLAQSAEGKAKLRDMLAQWVTHERARHSSTREERAKSAINHLLEALNAERRTHAERVSTERRH